MPAPGDQSPSSFDTDTRAFGPTAPGHEDAAAPGPGALVRRVIPVVLILGALAAAVAAALGTGAVKLPGSANAQASTQPATAARQTAANQQWASATCSTVLGWSNETQRDLHGLTLSPGAIPRVQDAIGATTRMVKAIEKRGLPPALQGAQGNQLRSDLQSQIPGIQSAASSVAGGNLGAIGTLLNDLRNAPAIKGQIVGHLRNAASELRVSLASSPSCRQLVGLKP
ncbi:MAG: hypothetical protein JO243_03430 [Solirubrobacterales bacterium]|nr:hypothetical protein [Solirubrobacterales bacterium]